MKTVDFHQMKDGTRAEYEFLHRLERQFAEGTADQLLATLGSLEDSLAGYRVSRLEHSLQAATRAWRDGADVDWVVAALLHDVGELHAPLNHAECAAAILKPFVREQVTWCVRAHGEFQLVYYGQFIDGLDPDCRERHRAVPYFEDCELFCERWDQASFDPDFHSKPIEFFAPMVRQVLARPAYHPEVLRPGEREPLQPRR